MTIPGISILDLPDLVFGQANELVLTGYISTDSDGILSFESINNDVATITEGDIINIVGAGTTTIKVSVEATDNYESAERTFTLTVAKGTQEIYLMNENSLLNQKFGNGSFSILENLSSTGDSEGFFYEINNSSVANITEYDTINIVGVGTATIKVSVEATDNYESAERTFTLTVAKGTQEITKKSGIPSLKFGDTTNYSLTDWFTCNANGRLSFESITPNVVTIAEGGLTIVGAGTATIKVTAGETDNYESAERTFTLTVAKGDPKITKKSGIPSLKFGDTTNYSLTNWFTCNANGRLSFESITPNVVTIAEGRLTIVGAGTATIKVNVSETDNYASSEKSFEFTVAKKESTITLTDENILNKIYGDRVFSIKNYLTTPSGGELTFQVSSEAVIKINGDKINIINAGLATIDVTLQETTNYNSATNSFNLYVAKIDPYIWLNDQNALNKNFGDPSFSLKDFIKTTSDAEPIFESTDLNVATILGSNITISGVGNTTIKVKLPAARNYNAMQQEFNLNVAKGDPKIELKSGLTNNLVEHISRKPFLITNYLIINGASISPAGRNNHNSDNTNSIGQLSFKSSSENVATIDAATGLLTILTAGTTNITVTIGATDNYNLGEKTVCLEILECPHEFTIRSKTYGIAPFNLEDAINADIAAQEAAAAQAGAQAGVPGAGAGAGWHSIGMINTLDDLIRDINYHLTNSGLPPSTWPQHILSNYVSLHENIATIDSNGLITIMGAGSASIKVRVIETDLYNSREVIFNFTVDKATLQSVSLVIPMKRIGDQPFLIPITPSADRVLFNYISTKPSIATIDNNGLITILKDGITNISIALKESSLVNYNPVNLTTQFQVKKVRQTIKNFTITDKKISNLSFTIPTPTSTSPGSFTYISNNINVVKINGNTATILGPGVVTITAIQRATAIFTPAIIRAQFNVTN